MAGVELPLEPVRRQKVYVKTSVAVPPDAPFTVDVNNNCYWRPEAGGVIIGWVDADEPHYAAVRSKMNWGPAHKIIGVHDAYLMVLGSDKLIEELKNEPHFTSGYDFV